MKIQCIRFFIRKQKQLNIEKRANIHLPLHCVSVYPKTGTGVPVQYQDLGRRNNCR